MSHSPKPEIEKSTNPSAAARPVLTIDYALYEKYLEGADLSEAQKQEFLDALWSIIVAFVDLGFGVHPLQQTGVDACGQTTNLTTKIASDGVSSGSEKPRKQFKKVADCLPDNRKGKGV